MDRLKAWIRARYEGRVMPWFLRWSLPSERPMLLVVGRRGAGKTLFAVERAIRRMERGEAVYANFPIEHAGMRAGRVHTLADCIGLVNCTIVIDEANRWASSRQWADLPDEVISGWQESRKYGVSWIFTAQHESRVDVIVRELVDWIVLCERVSGLPKWLPLFRTYWTFLEEISEIRLRRSESVSRPEIRWVGNEVMAAYQSHDPVDFSRMMRLREAVKAGMKIEAIKALSEPDHPMILEEDGTWRVWTDHLANAGDDA